MKFMSVFFLVRLLTCYNRYEIVELATLSVFAALAPNIQPDEHLEA